MVQSEKSLSRKHEDLRWHLQNPGKKQSSAAPTSDPSTGKAEPGEHWGIMMRKKIIIK